MNNCMSFKCFWNQIHYETRDKKINGGIYLYPEQVETVGKLLNDIKQHHDLVNVCESGFGSGHFASFILSYNFTRLVSFDLFEKKYKKNIVKLIQKKFGENRFTTIQGNSKLTIPNSIFPKCHLVHVSVPGNEYDDILSSRHILTTPLPD